MKAIVTVIGVDRVGIIAKISTILMEHNVNIIDLSQNVLNDIFTMTMIVDISKISASFEALNDALQECGKQLGLDVRLQKEEIFTAMHRI